MKNKTIVRNFLTVVFLFSIETLTQAIVLILLIYLSDGFSRISLSLNSFNYDFWLLVKLKVFAFLPIYLIAYLSEFRRNMIKPIYHLALQTFCYFLLSFLFLPMFLTPNGFLGFIITSIIAYYSFVITQKIFDRDQS